MYIIQTKNEFKRNKMYVIVDKIVKNVENRLFSNLIIEFQHHSNIAKIQHYKCLQ